MVDLETVGVHSFPVILSIGAVKFDFESPLLEPSEIARGITHHDGKQPVYFNYVKFDTCIVAGASVDGDTLDWWLEDKQAAARQYAFNNKDGVPLRKMLEDFLFYCKGTKYIWSHGAVFDIAILSNALEHLGLPTWPMDFRGVRDTRTLFDVADHKPNDWIISPRMIKHHPVWDAWVQSINVQFAWHKIKGKCYTSPPGAMRKFELEAAQKVGILS